VLEWICRRCDGEGNVTETPMGLVPPAGDIDTEGVSISDAEMRELLSVDPHLVAEQLPQIREHLARFGEQLPREVRSQLQALESRLN